MGSNTKPTSTTSPQRLHFISSIVLPGGISSMSRMCRPHFGFGHLILSTDNRLPTLTYIKRSRKITVSPCLVLSYHLCIDSFPMVLSYQKSIIVKFYMHRPNPEKIPNQCNPGYMKNYPLLKMPQC